jgi:hypothetical protein
MRLGTLMAEAKNIEESIERGGITQKVSPTQVGK